MQRSPRGAPLVQVGDSRSKTYLPAVLVSHVIEDVVDGASFRALTELDAQVLLQRLVTVFRFSL